MLKFVLDTDVIVAGMRSPTGASAALLRKAVKQKIVMLVSVPLFCEYESKCTNPSHWLEAGLTHEQAQEFINTLAAIVKPVKKYFSWRPRLHDPNDEMVLEAAVNGQADAIVTFNLRDYANEPKAFKVDVINPAEAIRRVRQHE